VLSGLPSIPGATLEAVRWIVRYAAPAPRPSWSHNMRMASSRSALTLDEIIIGTRFTGRLVRETRVDEFVAVDLVFAGYASIAVASDLVASGSAMWLDAR
jgi:hypothetical protein